MTTEKMTRTEVLVRHVTDIIHPVLHKLRENGYKTELVAVEENECITINLVVTVVEGVPFPALPPVPPPTSP